MAITHSHGSPTRKTHYYIPADAETPSYGAIWAMVAVIVLLSVAYGYWHTHSTYSANPAAESRFNDMTGGDSLGTIEESSLQAPVASPQPVVLTPVEPAAAR